MDARQKKILKAFKEAGARIQTSVRVTLRNRKDFALFYTPGVGIAAEYLAAHPEKARELSVKRNSVAVISDGSSVLGLGNIGPYGALPVMEGKALIFKEMADIDAWPIVLDTQDPEEIIRTVKAIAPGFGGINLEDIKAPECFYIENALSKSLSIPVMHDDQHGTAIVVLAGLINAAKVCGKNLKKLEVVISGAGAAGTAIAKLLLLAGVHTIVVLDRTGIISTTRKNLAAHKQGLARITNPLQKEGDLASALMDADVFIGVSGQGALAPSYIGRMREKPIIFALANPTPEIFPIDAKAAGAYVIATGRSDFPNQVNNALVFPGIFRGALDTRVTAITERTKLRAAHALASLVPRPTRTRILPTVLDKRVVPAVASAVIKERYT